MIKIYDFYEMLLFYDKTLSILKILGIKNRNNMVNFLIFCIIDISFSQNLLLVSIVHTTMKGFL